MAFSRAALALLAPLFFAVATPACGAADGSEDDDNAETHADESNTVKAEVNDALAQTAWDSVAAGSTTYKRFGSGNNVVVVCGGFRGSLKAVQAWTDELVRVKLGGEQFGQLISVIGPGLSPAPNTSAAIQKIKAVAGSAQSIVVIGHSSGATCSAQIAGGLGSLQAKTTLFQLDGWVGSEPGIGKNLMGAFYVDAISDGITSRNFCDGTAVKSAPCSRGLSAVGGTLTLDTSGSGCTAHDCVHDTLINSHPGSPTTYFVDNDYSNFSAGHTVETRYLDVLGKCLKGEKLVCPAIGGIIPKTTSSGN